MGRILVLLVALVVIAVTLWGLVLGVGYLRRTSKQRQREHVQRDLAKFAPAVLSGSPLLDVVIGQGRRLEEAADILRALTTAQLEVFIPDDHRQRISVWLDTHNKKEGQA